MLTTSVTSSHDLSTLYGGPQQSDFHTANVYGYPSNQTLGTWAPNSVNYSRDSSSTYDQYSYTSPAYQVVPQQSMGSSQYIQTSAPYAPSQQSRQCGGYHAFPRPQECQSGPSGAGVANQPYAPAINPTAASNPQYASGTYTTVVTTQHCASSHSYQCFQPTSTLPPSRQRFVNPHPFSQNQKFVSNVQPETSNYFVSSLFHDLLVGNLSV